MSSHWCLLEGNPLRLPDRRPQVVVGTVILPWAYVEIARVAEQCEYSEEYPASRLKLLKLDEMCMHPIHDMFG